MLENKLTLTEAADNLRSGMFIFIKGYVNDFGEKSDVTIHADANYKRTHENSAKQLLEIESDPNFSIQITRNTWLDADGNEHSRKAKGRTLKQDIKEIITPNDKDFFEAIARVYKSIDDPKKVEQGFNKVSNSIYDKDGKTYLRNVLIEGKIIYPDYPGKYPITCSTRVIAISSAIKKLLPIGQYRTYVLSDALVTLPSGVKCPRFEHISLMKEKISSSSSSSNE